MNRLIWIAIVIIALMPSQPISAGSPVRYALIVGNNHGDTTQGVDLEDLRYAEDEAQKIKEKLLNVGNFTDSENRVILMTGKTRNEIMQAAKVLSEQHRLDRQRLGNLPTMFAFFYTGHGLEGKLLTAGEPLTGSDLAEIFRNMGATFTIGIFDACFSGSLNLEMLRSKGIHVTEGFNAFDELPKEILNSQGTMWFVSSKPNQISYEDDRIGGVFSHFFLEGMEQAHFDGFGITLDDIWEYARSHTQRYTSHTGKPQTPEKLVRDLTTAAPLYFTFPSPRSATLVFTSDVSGHFLIHYESGQMTELINKEAGQAKQILLYPGEIILERLDNKEVESQHITLSKETTVWVRKETAWQSNNKLGVQEKQLVAKGGKINDLILTHEVPAWSGLLELDYRATFGSEFSPTPLNNGSIAFRLDHNWMSMRAAFSYGNANKRYEAWGYNLNRYDLSVAFGRALDWHQMRFDLSASALLLLQDLVYQDTVKRSRTGFGLGVETGALVPLFHRPFDLYLSGRIGLYAQLGHPVAPQNVAAEWRAIPFIQIGLVGKIF